MKIARVNEYDFTNGEGTRLSVFVSGCVHKCDGCYNKAAWKFSFGEDFTPELERKILLSLKDHDGLSILGGEPLHPRNRESVHQLLTKAKFIYPDKDVWLWTGYEFDEVKHLPLLDLVDYIIDGKYDKTKPTQKPWRGSGNQKLINLKNGFTRH